MKRRIYVVLAVVMMVFSLSAFESEVGSRPEIVSEYNVFSVEAIEAIITAYCPCKICCGNGSPNITALGDDARILDGVAVDFGQFAPRCKIYIPGVGIREADDTGGDMRTDALNGEFHIDVRLRTHEEAIEFGRRMEYVYVLPSGF